eukprot:8774283-Pyramimonas_sp.AAC.1
MLDMKSLMSAVVVLTSPRTKMDPGVSISWVWPRRSRDSDGFECGEHVRSNALTDDALLACDVGWQVELRPRDRRQTWMSIRRRPQLQLAPLEILVEEIDGGS